MLTVLLPLKSNWKWLEWQRVVAEDEILWVCRAIFGQFFQVKLGCVHKVGGQVTPTLETCIENEQRNRIAKRWYDVYIKLENKVIRK